MKRLTFSKKFFVRHNEQDFRDDGTNFRIYYYKDRLPISVATACGMRFIAIRLDYLGFNYSDYKSDYNILDMFNGCYEVNMEELIKNCEFITNKYLK